MAEDGHSDNGTLVLRFGATSKVQHARPEVGNWSTATTVRQVKLEHDL
jgi:hypothetical protein